MKWITRNAVRNVSAICVGAAVIGVTAAIAETGDTFEKADPVPVPICEFVPNGKFNDPIPDPNHWSVAPSRGGFGDHVAVPTIDIVDIGPPYDNALLLGTYSLAQFTEFWPAGSAASAKPMVRVDIDSLPYRNLVFDIAGGGFHGIVYDSGELDYSFSVIVENGTTGARFTKEVYGDRFNVCDGMGCGVGLGITGAFFPETVCITLPSGDFNAGDTVKLFLVFQSRANAIGECDEFSEFVSSIFIDNVRFCNSCGLQSKPVDELEVEVVEESLNVNP